jgi:sulfate-transporting ATPase
MAGVNKIYPPQKQVLKNIYLSFFYGAKDRGNRIKWFW